MRTLVFLDKKHVKFDQGLDFLNFPGEIVSKTRKSIRKATKTLENIRNIEEKALRHFLSKGLIFHSIYSYSKTRV